jgi:phosphoglycolate phosphatase-like HAD superfamily hydrolase
MLILFDIDGTLLRTQGAGRESTREAMLEVFGTASTIDNHHFGGKTDWQTLIELLTDHGYTREMIGQRFAAYEPVVARHLERIISTRNTTPTPGALEAVHALRQRDDVILGIVTGNVTSTAPIKLRAAGFDPSWFVVGAYGSEAVYRDDLPPIALRRAIDYSGRQIAPHEVIIIGDTAADVQCARALGAMAIAVRTGFSHHQELIDARPDHLLDDLTTLLDVLQL